MAAKNLDEAIKKYPELCLTIASGKACVYSCGKNRLLVPFCEARLYVRTYEYCKSLIRLDRYDAAKSIAFARNEYNRLPFDRLPFLALLTDPGHLVETVQMQPKLEIVPEVSGKRVSFYYEEGHRHQQVNGIFVGRHLRINSLCEDDVRHRKYDKAIMRAVSTPLSSRLIATYDAHIQCNQLLESFDYKHAQAMCDDFELDRDIKQEYRDIAMPLALEFRHLYCHHSRDAAFKFARVKGFTPVIRNNRLLNIKKAETIHSRFYPRPNEELADVPTLHYAISEGAISRDSYQQSGFRH